MSNLLQMCVLKNTLCSRIPTIAVNGPENMLIAQHVTWFLSAMVAISSPKPRWWTFDMSMSLLTIFAGFFLCMLLVFGALFIPGNFQLTLSLSLWINIQHRVPLVHLTYFYWEFGVN